MDRSKTVNRERSTAAVSSTTCQPRSGPIVSGGVYRAADVREALQLGTWAWRRLKRQGLVTKTVGGRSFALGSDVVRFFEALPPNSLN